MSPSPSTRAAMVEAVVAAMCKTHGWSAAELEEYDIDSGNPPMSAHYFAHAEAYVDAALAVAAQGPSETAKTAYRQQVAKDIARNPEDGGGDFEDWMLDRALRAAYRVDFGPAGEDG